MVFAVFYNGIRKILRELGKNTGTWSLDAFKVGIDQLKLETKAELYTKTRMYQNNSANPFGIFEWDYVKINHSKESYAKIFFRHLPHILLIRYAFK